MTPERLAELDAVMAKVAKAFPITSRETPDYAEITFGTSQTQAMSMEPDTLLALNELHNAYPDLKAHIAALEAAVAEMRLALLSDEAVNAASEAFFAHGPTGSRLPAAIGAAIAVAVKSL